LPYDDQSVDKKTQVTNMFDKIAPYYDFLNRLLTLGIDQRWRRKAILVLKDHPNEHILDLATGTADMPIMMHKLLNPTKITGIDISKNMIEIGQKKIANRKLEDQIELKLGDSERIDFESGTFDAATASFGVRNFGDLKLGLSEMHRVLKNQGKIVILEFSKPTIFPIKQLFNIYFKYILPQVGKLTSKDPKAYQYLYESVQAFPDYENFAEVMKSCGFKNVSWKALTMGICTIYTGEK